MVDGNPSLLRLLTYFLDKGHININNIRVAVEDVEEWDHLYPDFDREAGLASPRA